mgnify:CR=1 FL=1
MTARPIRRNAQTPDRNGKIFYTSTTSLSHISKNAAGVSSCLEADERAERVAAVDAHEGAGVRQGVFERDGIHVLDRLRIDQAKARERIARHGVRQGLERKVEILRVMYMAVEVNVAAAQGQRFLPVKGIGCSTL